MFRTSGLNAEIIDHLIDKPVVFGLGAGPSSFMASDLTHEQSRSGARSDDRFTHAVLEFAALSLSARAVLALRS